MVKFKELIADASWDEFYNTHDVNKALMIFYKIYNSAFEKAFPLKDYHRKEQKIKNGLPQDLKHVLP